MPRQVAVNWWECRRVNYVAQTNSRDIVEGDYLGNGNIALAGYFKDDAYRYTADNGKDKVEHGDLLYGKYRGNLG